MVSKFTFWICVCLMLVVLPYRLLAQDNVNNIEPVTSNDEWEPFIQEFDGVEMVLVPPGCLMMGSTPEQVELLRGTDASDRLFADESPQTEICFDEPYWIDRYEVTNAEFQRFVDAGGYEDAQYWSMSALNWMAYNIDYTEPANFEDLTDSQQPRVGISSFSANAYAQWRGCRIPTEAEWEYAVRGPDGLMYPWGNQYMQVVASRDGLDRILAAVGSYPDSASWVGAQDMVGSVWEWVNTLYEPYPYDPDDGREDLSEPEGVVENGWDTRLRVLRGASFAMPEGFLRSAVRHRSFAGNISLDFGFRCAREYEPDR